MKTFKRILAGVVLIVGAHAANAQLTLTCESGNKAIEQAACWGFGAVNYTNSYSYVINGSWSARSNSMTNSNINACWVKTPWIMLGSGNITLKTKLENSTGTTKQVVVAYKLYDSNSSSQYKEGDTVRFYTFNYPKNGSYFSTSVQNLTIPIPAEIANSTTPMKIQISFVGTGGSNRADVDNIIIPGTYWSDPGNNCLPMVIIQDADQDGVADNDDAYPNDPYRAYNSYFPDRNTFATLAFEDKWPSKGDYDFNDVVVSYRIQTVTDANNKVVEQIYKMIPKAAGATFRNSFGFQLMGVDKTSIIEVTGMNVQTGFNIGETGLEEGQSLPTIIVFDDIFRIFNSGVTYVNTTKNSTPLTADTINVKVIYMVNGVAGAGGPVYTWQLGIDQFNPFIVVNKPSFGRGREVHLPDFAPTDLADPTLFGTMDDNSDTPLKNKMVALPRYYKTVSNHPWGLNIIGDFQWPLEQEEITKGYPHFLEWAVSGGWDYANWYENNSGYRNSQFLY